jgi:hypothetical protein
MAKRVKKASGFLPIDDFFLPEKHASLHAATNPPSRVHHITLPKKTGATTNAIAKKRQEDLKALKARHAPSRFMMLGPEPMPTSDLLNPEPPSTEVLLRRSHRYECCGILLRVEFY